MAMAKLATVERTDLRRAGVRVRDMVVLSPETAVAGSLTAARRSRTGSCTLGPRLQTANVETALNGQFTRDQPQIQETRR
jgi:hypothetical protein